MAQKDQKWPKINILDTLMCDTSKGTRNAREIRWFEKKYFWVIFGVQNGLKWPQKWQKCTQINILATQCMTHQKTLEIQVEINGLEKKSFW